MQSRFQKFPGRWAACLWIAAWIGLTGSAAAQGSEAGAAPTPDLSARFKALEADRTQWQAALQRGRKVASFCANCHGQNGTSNLADVPNLAGQNSAYLLEQMKQFADGRRKDPFMGGLIRAMSESERLDAVVFFSSQRVYAASADDPSQVARGKSYYNHICFRCHGAEGLGDARIPRLAGQQKAYVTKTLRRYRDGTGERIEPLMAANTKLMSDDDIAAVAAYVSTMIALPTP